MRTIIFHLCLISPISCWHVTRLRATPSGLQMNGKAFTIFNPRSCIEIFEALTPTHSTTFFRGLWIVISSFINKAIFLSRKGLLSLFNKWNNSWLLVGVEFLFSCSTLYLTGELSSWTLEDKSHNYARPCIIPYQELTGTFVKNRLPLNLPRKNFRPLERLSQTRPQKASGEYQSRLSINNQIIHDCSKVAWSQILVRINHSLSPQFFQKFQLSWNNYSEKFTKKISKNKEKIKQP